MDLFVAFELFIAGALFGSFLNVCISRIPQDLSIIAPRSFCPQCRAPVGWRDNLPVLSWLTLRGRCRSCGKAITLRYPVVELLTAFLFVASYASFGAVWMTAKACIFCFLVIGLIFMDAETGLLPREFTWTGIALGLSLAWIVPVDSSGTRFLMSAFGWGGVEPDSRLSLPDAILAAVFGAGFFYVAWAVYYLLRKREGLGLGDIAMMAMTGAFLGLKLTMLVVFLAPILATLYALGWLMANPTVRKVPGVAESAGSTPSQPLLLREIPFGIFLGASDLVALFLGRQIWHWYLALFR